MAAAFVRVAGESWQNWSDKRTILEVTVLLEKPGGVFGRLP